MSIYLDADKFMDWVIEILSNEVESHIDKKISDTSWIETFDHTIPAKQKWQQHKRDRIITVLEGEGWQFQFDNDVPKMINSNEKLVIPKGVYHRLITGKTCLKLKIEEAED